MRYRIRVLAAICLVALVSWPGRANRPPSLAEARELLKDVAVHIDIETPTAPEICTGWIGWSEEGRSAVYTAGHCFQTSARYRLTLSTGEILYATGHVRWPGSDLMALWIPRGPLRAIRAWKAMPKGSFRALYILNGEGVMLEVAESQIPHPYPEIIFLNAPAAVALPMPVLPGTSGAPVLDAADSKLVGMVVGRVPGRKEIAAIIPASRIYKVLVNAGKQH